MKKNELMIGLLVGVAIQLGLLRVVVGEEVHLWTLYTAELGTFKVVIDKERLVNAKKVNLLEDELPLSLGDAARVAVRWAKEVHGDDLNLKVLDVVFVAESSADKDGFSYYKVTIEIADCPIGESGERRTIWENVPVMFDGKVLDRIPVKEAVEK